MKRWIFSSKYNRDNGGTCHHFCSHFSTVQERSRRDGYSFAYGSVKGDKYRCAQTAECFTMFPNCKHGSVAHCVCTASSPGPLRMQASPCPEYSPFCRSGLKALQRPRQVTEG